MILLDFFLLFVVWLVITLSKTLYYTFLSNTDYDGNWYVTDKNDFRMDEVMNTPKGLIKRTTIYNIINSSRENSGSSGVSSSSVSISPPIPNLRLGKDKDGNFVIEKRPFWERFFNSLTFDQ